MLWLLRIRDRLREAPRPDAAELPEELLSPAELVAQRRLAFLLRSPAHFLFAVAFLWPALSFAMLTWLFAAYLFVDAALALAPGGLGIGTRPLWPLFAGGLASLGTAIAAYGWPDPSFSTLVMLAAIWAMAVGAAYGAACFTLREADPDHLLLLSSIASLLFGRALLSHRATDLVVLSTWMGLYALTMGVVTLNFAVKQYRLS